MQCCCFFYECILFISWIRFFILPYRIINYIIISHLDGHYSTYFLCFYKYYYIQVRGIIIKCLREMITQQQYEYRSQLQNDSLNYFCFYCKRLLKHTVRILAKLNGQKTNYINICPACLATNCSEMGIKQYRVCNKMGQIVEELNNKSVEMLISCISMVENKGIQQIQTMRQGQQQENTIKQSYLELNDTIFESQNLGYKEKQPKYVLPQYQPVVKDNDPPNRKHLKALGYNWSREQFQYLPESVFGLLLGSLEKDQGQDQEQFNTLSSILFRQYQKQQQKIQQTKDYLVNTMFLLGKKGFSKMGMPQPLLQLRQKQEQIKEVISKIHNLINQFEQQQKNDSPKNEKKHKGDKNKKQKKKKKYRSQQNKSKQEEQYQRSREAKKKKQRQDQQSQGKQQRKKKNKQSKKQHKQPQREQSPTQKQEIKKLVQMQQQLSKKQIISDPKTINNEPNIKKSRGRPKGSITRAKILGGKFIAGSLQKDKMQQQVPLQRQKADQSEQQPKQKRNPKKPKQNSKQQQGFEVQFDSD